MRLKIVSLPQQAREKVESELRRVQESYSLLENGRRQEEQRTTEKEEEVCT